MPPCPLLPQVPAPQPWIRCLETKDLVPDWPGDVGHLTCYYRACLLTCKMGSGQKSPPMGLVCTSVSSQSDRQTDKQALIHTHSHPPTHIPSHTHRFARASAHAFTYICAARGPLLALGAAAAPFSISLFLTTTPPRAAPFLFSFLSHLLAFTSPLSCPPPEVTGRAKARRKSVGCER